MRQEDVLRVKRAHPEMVMYKDPLAGTPNSQTETFSQREDSPFKDVRLRRAASMLIDRDLFIDTFFNLPEFRNAGLPVEPLWTSHMAVKGYSYIDPRSKDIGEGGKFFEYNVPEAKKLIEAAGNPQIEYSWRNNPAFQWQGFASVLIQMWKEGFRLSDQTLDNNAWRNAKESGGENFRGIFQNTAFGFNDDAFLASKYTTQGKDRISNKPIPGITDAVRKARVELDPKRRLEALKQIQRDLAVLMPDVPAEREVTGFSLRWPWFRNYGVFAVPGFGAENSSARAVTEYWYDASKKT
jgi:ABC-type transport system substrate-binding protein